MYCMNLSMKSVIVQAVNAEKISRRFFDFFYPSVCMNKRLKQTDGVARVAFIVQYLTGKSAKVKMDMAVVDQRDSIAWGCLVFR